MRLVSALIFPRKCQAVAGTVLIIAPWAYV